MLIYFQGTWRWLWLYDSRMSQQRWLSSFIKKGNVSIECRRLLHRAKLLAPDILVALITPYNGNDLYWSKAWLFWSNCLYTFLACLYEVQGELLSSPWFYLSVLKFNVQVFQKFISRQPCIRKHLYLDHRYTGRPAFIPWLLITTRSMPRGGARGQNLGHL